MIIGVRSIAAQLFVNCRDKGLPVGSVRFDTNTTDHHPKRHLPPAAAAAMSPERAIFQNILAKALEGRSDRQNSPFHKTLSYALRFLKSWDSLEARSGGNHRRGPMGVWILPFEDVISACQGAEYSGEGRGGEEVAWSVFERARKEDTVDVWTPEHDELQKSSSPERSVARWGERRG